MKSSLSFGWLLIFPFLILGTPAARAQFFFTPNSLVGEAAPDFTMKNLEGEKLSLNQYRDGKSAVIFFWATWCPHCRRALQGLNQNAHEFEDKGIKLILVDLGETAEEVGAYLKKTNMNLNVFLDEDTSLAETYGIIGVPTFLLVNKDGIVKQIDHTLPENYEEILLP